MQNKSHQRPFLKYAMAFPLLAMFVGAGLSLQADSGPTLIKQIQDFKLLEDPKNQKEVQDRNAEEATQDAINNRTEEELAKKVFKNAKKLESSTSNLDADGSPRQLIIKIFQNYKKVGKQFLVAIEKDEEEKQFVRYAFAVSAGKGAKITPDTSQEPKLVAWQSWRHMSTLYPGTTENNMDHVSYFLPAIGFHATTFGNYSRLGRADSHGCIRLGRPEARAIYTLIKSYGKNNVLVYSYQKEEPEDELVAAVQEKLLVDLKHIKSMITARKNGDFALNERNYMRYLDNKLYDKKDISGLKENNLGYYNQLVLEDFNEKIRSFEAVFESEDSETKKPEKPKTLNSFLDLFEITPEMKAPKEIQNTIDSAPMT